MTIETLPDLFVLSISTISFMLDSVVVVAVVGVITAMVVVVVGFIVAAVVVFKMNVVSGSGWKFS